MKRKKAVCGRLGAFGSLDFLSVLAFFAFGSVELDFFLPNKKSSVIPSNDCMHTQRKGREEEYLSVVVEIVGFFLGGSLGFSTI